MSKQPPPPPTPPAATAIGPCPTIIEIVGCPGTGSLPRTIAPPDHPYWPELGRLHHHVSVKLTFLVPAKSAFILTKHATPVFQLGCFRRAPRPAHKN